MILSTGLLAQPLLEPLQSLAGRRVSSWVRQVQDTWTLNLHVSGQNYPCSVRNGFVDHYSFDVFLRANHVQLGPELSEFDTFKHLWPCQSGLALGKGLSWFRSPVLRPTVGELVTGLALFTNYPGHPFLSQQLLLIMGQAGLSCMLPHVASNNVGDLPLAKFERRDKGLLGSWVREVVCGTSGRGLPELLRKVVAIGSVGSTCRQLYRETMQRYLMRVRVDFASSRVVTICVDKSKVLSGAMRPSLSSLNRC